MESALAARGEKQVNSAKPKSNAKKGARANWILVFRYHDDVAENDLGKFPSLNSLQKLCTP